MRLIYPRLVVLAGVAVDVSVRVCVCASASVHTCTQVHNNNPKRTYEY